MASLLHPTSIIKTLGVNSCPEEIALGLASLVSVCQAMMLSSSRTLPSRLQRRSITHRRPQSPTAQRRITAPLSRLPGVFIMLCVTIAVVSRPDLLLPTICSDLYVVARLLPNDRKAEFKANAIRLGFKEGAVLWRRTHVHYVHCYVISVAVVDALPSVSSGDMQQSSKPASLYEVIWDLSCKHVCMWFITHTCI